MYNRNFIQLLSGRNFVPVLQQVLANKDLFDLDTTRQNFKNSPQRDTRAIICRMTYEQLPENAEEMSEDELMMFRVRHAMTELQAQDTEAYYHLPLVYEEVMTLAAAMNAEQIGRVVVTELKAGGRVLPHEDFGPYHDYYDRLHLVIGGEGCHFTCGKEVVKMLPGDMWMFNNREVHEVHNDSAVARYHIVVDMKLRGDRLARWPEVSNYGGYNERYITTD
jgi:quercetin dioxygenase-like cupin family protein